MKMFFAMFGAIMLSALIIWLVYSLVQPKQENDPAERAKAEADIEKALR